MSAILPAGRLGAKRLLTVWQWPCSPFGHF